MRRSHKVDNLAALSQDMAVNTTLVQSLMTNPKAIDGEAPESNDSLPEISYSSDEKLNSDTDTARKQELEHLQKSIEKQKSALKLKNSKPIAIPQQPAARTENLRGFSIFTAYNNLMRQDEIAALAKKSSEVPKRK